AVWTKAVSFWHWSRGGGLRMIGIWERILTLAIGMLLIVGLAGEGVAEGGSLGVAGMAVAGAPVQCTAEQTAGVIPCFGLHALMDVQVWGPGVVTEITFELEETTDPADVAGLSVYYTGSGTEFRPLQS